MKPEKALERRELDVWEWEEILRDIAEYDIGLLAEFALKIDAAATPGPWHIDWDSCDCSDGLCSHGRFPYAIILPEPIYERHEGQLKSYDQYNATEISEFTINTALFIAFARTALPLLARDVLAPHGTVRLVNEYLAQVIKPEAINEWWEMPMAKLGGQTPTQRMAERGINDVLAIAKGYQDTSYT